DIGTRKVAGIIAQVDNTGLDMKIPGTLKILDCEILEHRTRAMMAGQIHDIEKVAEVVQQIKEALEQRTGEKLTKVAVAVAGRVLKTLRAGTSQEISFDEEIKAEDVFNLEMAAVQNILGNLAEQKNMDLSNNFYCVGYSVVCYRLDGQKIENLIGQKGSAMEVEVIITFLPRIVLESLFSMLKRVNLEVSFLTLEPIAAINAIIPQDMRRMNLVLIDVGAGTSDIAITEEGSIINYGMVAHAGDDITERLCERYLMDFNSAERIKRQLSGEQVMAFTDIFGRQREFNSTVIADNLSTAVRDLAKKIVAEVLQLNQKVPHAIVCVGGGSRTFGLEDKLAEEIGISRERVGIRGPKMIRAIEDRTGKLEGPEAVTPLGIALLAGQKQGLQFINVSVNGRKTHLLNINQNLNVLTALVASGVNTKKLYAKPGLSKTYEINGEIGVIKGTLGKPAAIKVNQQNARLDTFISDKDEIIFEEPENGQDGRATVSELLGDRGVTMIILNDSQIKIMPDVFINGGKVSYDTEVIDRAKINIMQKTRLIDALRGAGFDIEENQERKIMITVEGEPRILTQQSYKLTVNDQEMSMEEVVEIKDGDIINYEFYESTRYQVKDVVGLPKSGKSLQVRVNGEDFTFPGESGKIIMNGQEVSADDMIPNGADIQTIDGKNAEAILVDIFKFISLKMKDESGKKLRLLINGQDARFTSLLEDGHQVEVYFE
ncbi:MAG: cell division FtsA domain-containing protein, partial [bacterium]